MNNHTISAGVVLAFALGCSGTGSQAKKLLDQGDWAGARNVLGAGMDGGTSSVADRGLMLVALAAPDAARGGSDFWFIKACALDETASTYILAPTADEAEKVDRLRNDMRRQLKDKGVDTASVGEYGQVLRSSVHYALTEHVWKPDQAMVQGAMGLCGLWLGEPDSDKALMASLGSQEALSKGSDRFFSVAGDRILGPLRSASTNKDNVASGPAMDILQSLLQPIAQQTVLAAVAQPLAPRDYVRSVAMAEKLRGPEVSGDSMSIASGTASSRVRAWFGFEADAKEARIAGWSAQTLSVKGHTLQFSWTWDQQAAAGKLFALTWSNSDWTRLTFDGQDPMSAPGQVVLSVGPVGAGENGDFAMDVMVGVGDHAETVQTWAGPVVQHSREFQIEHRVFTLDGVSAHLVAVPATP